MKKLQDKKEEKEDKVAKLQGEVEELVEEEGRATGQQLLKASRRLKRKKEELKERQDKLRLLKGQPVTLKKFLEEVVQPKCKLCPPHSKCKQPWTTF